MAAKVFDVFRVTLLGLLAAWSLVACAPEAPVAVADYPAKLVGEWLGTVGDTKETIKFNADKSFVAEVRPAGFISNTLGQGITGTIRGTWTIAGKVVTLTVDSTENERVANRVTTSTIESFKTNELVVRSDSGTVTTFGRAL